MKSLLSVIGGLVLSSGVSLYAHATWLVDEARWHVSAHGPIMCLDCHADVGKDAPHPDPANVGRSPGGFLRAELCGGCHDAVFTDLAAGRHGGQPLKADQDYQRCRDCHDPHYQSRITDPGKYDSSKAPTNQCDSCHEIRERLPELSPADEACMSCHRRWDPKSSEAVQHSKKLCLGCHGQDSSAIRSAKAVIPPIIDMGPEGFRPHRDLSCLSCHPQAVQYGHARQKPGDCRQCHARHDEAVIHDAHPSVSCGACHLKQVFPRKERESGLIDWVRLAASPSRLHDMTLSDDEGACRRCHHSRNAAGAAAMVLPAKSILCMPCHAATFSVSDTTTILALIVFSAGSAVSITYWFSGALPGATAAGSFHKAVWIIRETSITIFSSKIWGILKILALDGLLQRTLYRRSPSRWLTHGLMVWPLALRFLWGIVALMASLYAPGRAWPWAMLDKNHPVHGLFFDATGLMIIVGAAATMLRGASGPSAKLPSMPPHDRLASGLLGAIVLMGFVLEAMRIAMTGYPFGSAYAFVGDALSRFFWGVSGLEDIYGYVWYLHAVLTGAFVAYLPFSRLFHILLAPVLLALNAADNNKQHQPQERVHRNRTE